MKTLSHVLSSLFDTKYNALSISHGIFSLKNSKKIWLITRPYGEIWGELWGVFCEFTVWTNSSLSCCHIVSQMMLYFTPIYEESKTLGVPDTEQFTAVSTDHVDIFVVILKNNEYHRARISQGIHAPSQWETSLQCNPVFHWLGAHLDWSLIEYHHVSELLNLRLV